MKKIVVLFALILCAYASKPAFAQVAFGVKGTFAFYNLTIKDPDVDTKMIPSFNAGVFADIPIADQFYLRPEALFAQKGAKYDAVDGSLKPSYVEVPVTFLYKGPLGTGKVLVGLGPYIAMGIGGKSEVIGISQDIKYKKEPTIAELALNRYLKPMDFGAKIYAGYQLGAGLGIVLESYLGLTSVNPEITYSGISYGSDMKNVGFGIGLTYGFSKK